MPEDLFVTRFIMELLPAAASTMSDGDLSNKFIESIKRDFGIDDAVLSAMAAEGKSGSMEDYIANTRKEYVDNQLSGYSAFPELVGYKNRGYGSCAVIPLMANGKVAWTLLLLSKEEGKFQEEIMRTLNAIAAFFSFSFMYKSEIRKNGRLAEYFDSSFNSAIPQMLVSADDSIIKANRSAVKAFDVPYGQQSIKKLFGIGFAEAKALGENGADVYPNVNNSRNIYRLTSRKVGDSLLHMAAANVTGNVLMDSVLDAVSNTDDIYIIFAGADLGMISASPNFQRRLKYSEGPFPGKRLTDFIKEGDAKALMDSLKENPDAVNVSPMNLMGGDFTLSVRALLKKVPFGYLAVLVNTESESYAKESGENVSDFVESSSDIVLTIDEFGYIKGCNMPVEKVLGYAKDELVGREAKQLYKDPSLFDKDIQYVRDGKKIDGSYVDLIKKDSDIVPATQSVRLLRGAGTDSRYMVVIKELESKRRLEDMELELREREGRIKRLGSIGELKSEFIYNISHELKTPITNIKGFSSLLLDGQAGELNDNQKDYVKTIIDESDRLILIIQQVLDASKLEVRKVKLDIRGVDLKQMSKNPAIKALEELAKNKGLDFRWTADYDVPEINADPNRLVQVFVNLIGNAVKFTEKGSITVRIFMKTKRTLECDVIDTGIGISEEDRKKLFRKFYQAQKKALVRQDGAGTGLGLSITREIVKLHGGKINVESTHGQGSRFWFTLPLKRKRQKDRQDKTD